MNKKQSIAPLRSDASDEEIVRFFEEHDPEKLERAGLVTIDEDRSDLEELLRRYLSTRAQRSPAQHPVAAQRQRDAEKTGATQDAGCLDPGAAVDHRAAAPRSQGRYLSKPRDPLPKVCS